MGRNKKPAEVKKLQNTYRPDRETDLSGSSLENVPPAPDRLDEDGQYFYYQYANHLKEENRLTFEALKIVEDLSWWESQRKSLEDAVIEIGSFHTYFSESGEVKHTAPTGPFTNLRAATSEIDRLRRRLGFNVPEKSSKPQMTDYERKKKKNF